jgi:H+/Cl- antiporter ClcA
MYARAQATVRRIVEHGVGGDQGRFYRLVVAVGLISGLAGAAYIVVLNQLISWLGPGNWNRPIHLVVMGVTGLAIGGLTLWLGSPGETELLVDNIHVGGGPDDVRDLRSLIPVSLLGIGAGSAIGPEAPLVQTTGSLGSWLARRRNLAVDDRRVLTITGMAAGFTVLFGAPLGSALFALEILHRRGLQYYEALLPAGIGSLTGYVVYLIVRGVGVSTIWHFPSVGKLHATSLLVGLGAGIVGAVLATAFTYLTRLMRRLFHLIPAFVRPIIGGLALGGLAFASPFALTYGEKQLQVVINEKVVVGTLLLAVLAKFVATSTIMSAGWRGGFIIPMFFFGAALGQVAGHVMGIDSVVAMTALMAAINVGVTKTPYGSTLVVTEMAGVRVLPSTFLAAVVALVLTSRVSMIETQREREDPFMISGPEDRTGESPEQAPLVPNGGGDPLPTNETLPAGGSTG